MDRQSLQSTTGSVDGLQAAIAEATKHLQEVMRHADEGKAFETLNGSVTVLQSLFAVFLRRSQGLNMEVNRLWTLEDISIKYLETTLTAQREKLEAQLAKQQQQIQRLAQRLRNAQAVQSMVPGSMRSGLHVIIVQQQCRTSMYSVQVRRSLAAVLEEHASSTGQSASSLLVISAPGNGDVLVEAPDEVEFEPEEVGENGSWPYRVFEVRRVANLRRDEDPPPTPGT